MWPLPRFGNSEAHNSPKADGVPASSIETLCGQKGGLVSKKNAQELTMRHVAPNDFYKGDLMRRQRRATLHLSHIVLIGLFGVYAPLLSGQEIHATHR
jgi:hypothetical protein